MSFSDWFERDEQPEWLVEIETGSAKVRTNVYRGTDKAEALRLTEFWDERVNTYLTEPTRKPNDYLSVAMRKFNALKEYVEKGGLG